MSAHQPTDIGMAMNPEDLKLAVEVLRALGPTGIARFRRDRQALIDFCARWALHADPDDPYAIPARHMAKMSKARRERAEKGLSGRVSLHVNDSPGKDAEKGKLYSVYKLECGPTMETLTEDE